MILGTLDDFDNDDSEMPFRTRVGRRALPAREIVQPDEAMTLLERAVHCGAFGGVWLTVKPCDIDEVSGLWADGIAALTGDRRMWQLTVQGAREMGLLPIDQLAYPDAALAREAGVSVLMGEGESE